MNLRQKDTELKMLQAQINPHFLYNSLETVRGMALERDMDDIAVMAASLARLLRYNIKESSAIVTVEQEMEIGEIYLRIQKYRFEEKLEYHFNIPPWAINQQIPTFTLQPLLENCVVHGVEPLTGCTTITVTAEKVDHDSFVIMISDTGPGIPQDILEDLTRKLEQSEHIDVSNRHIGIMNVHKRVRHILGDEYGVFFQSELNKGTMVGIKLPLQELVPKGR